MFTISVIGRLWNGAQSAYDYTTPAIPADDAAVKRLAGDFMSIDDWQAAETIINTQHLPGETITTKREIVRRPFTMPDSEDVYLDCVA